MNNKTSAICGQAICGRTICGDIFILAGIAITTPPTKTVYYAGETFNPTGMVVTAGYNNGTSQPVASYSCAPNSALTISDTAITVSYTEDGIKKTATQNITVNPVALTGIAVTAPPNKTVYFEGETFNQAGMIVKASYNDGSSQQVSVNINPSGPLTLSDTVITLSCQGKTTTQSITVNPAIITSIAITTPPIKTAYYAGETFNPTDMVVTASYNNGTSRSVAGYTYPMGTLSAGTASITVSYTESSVTKTVSQNITVSAFTAEPAQTAENFKRDSSKAGQSEQSYSCGTGAAAINLFTGRLMYENVASVGGDLQITQVFNSRLNNRLPNSLTGATSGTTSYLSSTAKGWKLNLQQFLLPKAAVTGSIYGSDTDYIYIDASGVEHEFKEILPSTSPATYEDKDGLGLEYDASTGIMTDKNKTDYYFSSYRLTKIKDAYNKEIRINYVSGGIGTVEMAANNIVTSTYTFAYNTVTGMLETITAPDGGITFFVYETGAHYRWLEKVLYPDRKFTKFEYESHINAGSVPYLDYITDPSGYKMHFAYDSNSPRNVYYFVEGTSYTEITGTTATSGSMQGGRTAYMNKVYGNGLVENEKGVHTRYMFDENNKTYAVYQDNATSGDISSAKTVPVGDIVYNGPHMSARIPHSSANILTGTWAFYENNTLVSSPSSGVFRSETGYTAGPVSYHMAGDINKSRYMKLEVPSSSFPSGLSDGRFILSGFCFVHGSSGPSGSPNNQFGLMVELTYSGVPNPETAFVPFTRTLKNSWQFSATAIDLKIAGLTKITVYAIYSGNADNVVFSNIRFIKGSANITESKYFIDINEPKNGFFTADDIRSVHYSASSHTIQDVNSGPPSYQFTIENLLKAMKDPCDATFYDYSGNPVTQSGLKIIKFGVLNRLDVSLGHIVHANCVIADDGSIMFSGENRGSNKKTIQGILYPNGKICYIEGYYDANNRLIQTIDYLAIVTDYEYDASGNLLKTTTYRWGEETNGVPTNPIVREYGYDASEKYLIEETDERQHDASGSAIKTLYDYNTVKGLLNTVTMPNSQSLDYDYDAVSNDLMSVSSTVNSTLNSNGFGYNKGYVTKVSHNGLDYDFKYNGWGDIKEVKVAGNTLVSKAFTYSSTNDSESAAYKNGYYVVKEYDKYGRFSRQHENSSDKVQNIYDCASSGAKLTQRVDGYAGNTYNINYDADGGVSGISVVGNTPMTVGINKNGSKRVTGTNYSLDGSALSYTYEYTKDWQGADYPGNKLAKTTLTNKFESAYAYDTVDRTSGRTLTKTGGGLVLNETYTYKDAVDSSGFKTGTTGYINTVTQKVNGTTQDTYGYTYDRNGNITQITGGSQGTITYTYDALNRLISETRNGYTASYTYDAGGNISSKTVNGVTLNYTYGSSWKDQLTSYGGQAITYDGCGNPLSYRNGITMTWARGRMLQSYEDSYVLCNFTYNAEGFRTKKVVQTKGSNGSTVEHRYWLEGSRIIKEAYAVIGGNINITTLYYYDATGICGMNYNGTDYYFRKNLQGDVTHIYNTSGTLVGSYTYDAWGNYTIGTNTNAIATNNPFRYRGYYLDTVTQLYYCGDRYYDPQIGRFISPAPIESFNSHVINGLNLYAYNVSGIPNNPLSFSSNSANIYSSELNSGFGFASGFGGYDGGFGVAGGFGNGTAQNGNDWKEVNTLGLDIFGHVVDIGTQVFKFLGKNPNAAKWLGVSAKVGSAVGNVLFVVGAGLTIYNNFSDPSLTTGQKWGFTAMDLGVSVGLMLLAGAGTGPVGWVCLGLAIAGWALYEFVLKDWIRSWFK